MRTFDIAPHKCKANSEVLTLHIGRMLTCTSRHVGRLLLNRGENKYNHLEIIIASVEAPKISSIFQGKFRKKLGPKNLFFPKFCHNIQYFVKNCNFI